MPTRFRDLSGREYWNLAWPFGLSLMVGFLLRVFGFRVHLPYWLPEDIVVALADAFVVAGIVGLLLELFATRLLVEKISGDLSEKLVGRGLPAELQSHISEIAKTALVRE